MKKDESMPPPARPLSKEDLTCKVKEFPVNYGATIVGITTLDTLAGGPPSTDLTYVLEGARSAVTFAVPLDEDKTRDYLGKIDRSGHQKDYTRASVIADGIAAQLASFLRQFGHDVNCRHAEPGLPQRQARRPEPSEHLPFPTSTWRSAEAWAGSASQAMC